MLSKSVIAAVIAIVLSFGKYIMSFPFLFSNSLYINLHTKCASPSRREFAKLTRFVLHFERNSECSDHNIPCRNAFKFIYILFSIPGAFLLYFEITT